MEPWTESILTLSAGGITAAPVFKPIRGVSYLGGPYGEHSLTRFTLPQSHHLYVIIHEKSIMAPAQDVIPPQSPRNDDNVYYTVLIRLPFPRGDFVDPPEVCCILDITKLSRC